MKLLRKHKVILAIAIVLFVFFVSRVGEAVIEHIVKTPRCDRELPENILIPIGEIEKLRINLLKWDLQVAEKGVININTNQLIPIARGQTELITARKDIPNCSFVSTVSVVNFQETIQSGTGRVGF
jgi:hypothetical protein